MNGRRFYKPVLSLLAIVLLIGASGIQNRLNRDRAELGLTRRDEPLENAPPMLAFATVALGGFRGLIANVLWVRANELQLDGKYFEMVQLADWITKLQPHSTTVWLYQAWNMAYNISVKFPDHEERWLWVKRGIELLRDEGIRYNPHETLLYRELGWFFQHKMGNNMDDAHLLYKYKWSVAMEDVLGSARPNFEELLEPQTDEARERVRQLREVYKMEPRIMKQVDERYGPLEWRLPETHAIYWATAGMERAKPEDIITLRRLIYQSMQLAVQRGRMIENKIDKKMEFGPNIEMIPNANAAYEQMMEEDPETRDHIVQGHRSFLQRAISDLYVHNRLTAAEHWFQYLKDKYPEIMYGESPTLEQYVLRRVKEQVDTASGETLRGIIEGTLIQSFYYLAIGEDDQAIGLERFASKVWLVHQEKIFAPDMKNIQERLQFPPFAKMKQDVLDRLIDPERGAMSPQLAAQLITRLGYDPRKGESDEPAVQPDSKSTVKPPANAPNAAKAKP